ncbi:MAG TPA: hypothetical protein VE669_04000, partial [Actinomycetota bacterium]|nr:hypothetical protein [Actinomycetota bacterium]
RLKTLIANGYREGRSPDVLGVTGGSAVWSRAGGAGFRAPWPGVGLDGTAVPLAFAGAGVAIGAELPDGVTLDRVAPTVAEILGFHRPFPEVRSGTPIRELMDGETEPPRLVLLIAWKGVGSRELTEQDGEWSYLASLAREGSGTLAAVPGSLPLDPAAVLTTIGTGGLPSQHGITGSFVRNDVGDVVPAFGEDSPVQVITTLADDLEHADRRTLVGLVARDPTDEGLVGGGWYPDQDPVDTIVGQGGAAALAVRTLLAVGFGADDVPDVIGVALDGPVRALDRRTHAIVREAEEATDGSVTIVIAGTGSPADRRAEPDGELLSAVEDAVPGEELVVDTTVPGGLFLDQGVLARAGLTGQAIVDALLELRTREGERMMADAFQGFAVSFARYC